MHDTLTDLPNRVALQKRDREALDRWRLGALLFLDIDHFKYVNDNFGHRTGDQMIIGVGSVLRGMMRDFAASSTASAATNSRSTCPEALRAQASRRRGEARSKRCATTGFRPATRREFRTFRASIGIALYPFHGPDVAASCRTSTSRCTRPRSSAATATCCSTRARTTCAARTSACIGRRSCATRSTTTAWRCSPSRSCASRDQKPVHHEILLRLRDDDGKIIMPVQLHRNRGIARSHSGNRHARGREAAAHSCTSTS